MCFHLGASFQLVYNAVDGGKNLKYGNAVIEFAFKMIELVFDVAVSS